MLLVYTHKITPRVSYIFKHICTRILGIKVSLTTSVEEFIAHDSLKMSYTKQPLGNEFFIRSHELLYEQGLSDIDIHVQEWEHTKGFFPTNEKSGLPYDIFAASFYLLSRYEEYLPHVKDDYGRFVGTESLGYKEGFLRQPVVDIWAYLFKDALQALYGEYEFPTRKYKVQPIIDVPMAFYYDQKGLLRTFGGTVKDLYRLRLRHFYKRYLVLAGLRRDPYDTFKWIITKQKQCDFKFIVFFLIGDYSTYDKNININKKEFVSLIKSVADYCKVGLKVSYFALDSFEVIKKEKRMMESVVNYELEASRNSFSKLNLPETYRNLIELEVKQDFTMGYINLLGFRAGTCTPFQFYDLDYEVQTPLQINTFHLFDSALLSKASLLDKKEELQRLMDEVKKVNGTFAPVFHNHSFSNEERWKGFRELFSDVLDSVNEA
ncbi:polysaccharide deacetylase family protein [Subsaxibacter sp. CAU 1640]|uniref:polysaccharide deacetylase family protein n=1 Tax=Subsaxibacter sp. CAU 1640 TaxID=2933271 RepID=UPI002005A45D|nr:polysaccharide deacetylase family protein [Subsaxibacter sp. CAU 1640]MCK7591936.1 polysaccharide deacetylase family protein [Subsaxibacter sp. CAU 1640]